MRATIFFLLLLLVTSCDSTESNSSLTQNERIFYATKAYEQLSETERATITTPIADAYIEQGYLTYNGISMNKVKLESYDEPVMYESPLSSVFENGTPVVVVRFNTTDDALLGPITLILLEEDGLLIGWFLRL